MTYYVTFCKLIFIPYLSTWRVKSQQIERGDPNGTNRITIVAGLSHPWGVAIYDNYLYFTDRDFEVIERVDKSTGVNRVVLRDNVSGLRVLKVHYRESEYHRETSPSSFAFDCFSLVNAILSTNPASVGTSNGCTNNMGVCEQLCLPRPHGLFSCACATGFKLNADNRTCTPYQSYVVISTLSAIKGLSLEGSDHSEAMVPVAGRGRLFLIFVNHSLSFDTYYAMDRGGVNGANHPPLRMSQDAAKRQGCLGLLTTL